MKKLLTGLFRAARKRLQTTDNDMGMFRDKLNALVDGKDAAGDEEIASSVNELVEMTNDLPESEDKAKLLRFIEDFKSVKEQDAAVAKEAAKAVADLFEKLDTEAMKDTPEAAVPAEDPAAEEGAETAPAVDPEGTEPAADPEAAVEEKDAACEEDAEKNPEETQDDGDNNAEYTLEEIYQFIKKRMAEDSAEPEENIPENPDEEAGTEDAEAPEADKDPEEEAGPVEDHALNIQLPGNKKAAAGTLAGMFAQIKNGGR